MPGGVIALDRTAKVRWFNPYAESFFNKTFDAVKGKHFKEVFSDFPSWRELIERLLNSQNHKSMASEFRLTLPDGKEKIVEYSCSFITHDSNEEKIFLCSSWTLPPENIWKSI